MLTDFYSFIEWKMLQSARNFKEKELIFVRNTNPSLDKSLYSESDAD